MRVIVVVPSYNEKENIGKFIDALEEVFKKRSHIDFQILVVDGNSPDGTGEVVLQKAKVFPNVQLLLEKEKAGIGGAYLYGFDYAQKNLAPDVLLEIDADFQHNPEDVVRLTDEIENGYDYVIASRFVKGGTIPKDWQFYRKFLSRGGNLFSKIVLGILEVNDFTSGFKAARVKGFVDKIDLDSVMSKSFAYKIDLLFKMHKLGAKFKEIPVDFGLRDRGNSKMERNNFADSLRVVLTLRYNENQNFFKFLIVGVAGLIVDSTLFNILRLVPEIGSSFSAIISGGLAMLTTFLLNNFWSFDDRKLGSGQKKITAALLYFASSTIPILVRSQIVHYFTFWFGDTFIISNIAFVIGVIFGLVWNFTVYSKIIWKKH